MLTLSRLLCLAFLLSACASAEPASPVLSGASAPLGHFGADPKINDPFRDPTLDLGAWSDRFEGESREVYRSREAIIALLSLRPGMTVADVGTGTGLFVKYLADAVGPTGRVIATDISERFVAHVRERAARAGLSQVEVRLGATTDAGLDRESVDLVFVCDVYHHFEAPMPMLASLFDALKPGGRLVILDFHRIPGKTSDFIMNHVRAGREVVLAEVEQAGFTKLPDPPTPFLEDNYIVVFERP